MTKKIFYERVVSPGGRISYVPVYEYDQELLDSFTRGSHLVIVYPGGKSFRYNIDPDYASLIAAGRVAEDAISASIMRATELRRNSKMPKKMTPSQRRAWDKLIEEFGDDAQQLEWPSAREAAEEAVKTMQEEADKLLTVPAVREAWDNFQTLCELTRKH